MSAGQVSGRAIVYNVETIIGLSGSYGSFREVVAPQALKGVDLSDVAMLRDHDWSRVVARASAGSLKLTNSQRGLEFTAKLADTGDGRDLFTLVSGREVKGCSFLFASRRDQWYDDNHPSGLPLRVIEEIVFMPEISCVTAPAYPSTTVAAGSAVPRSSSIPPAWLLRARMTHGMSPSPTADPHRYTARGLNRPGCKPIQRPSWAPKLTAGKWIPGQRVGDVPLERREASAYGEPPIELTAALMEPDVSTADLLRMYGADRPSYPGRAGYSLAAYRSLAEQRGVPLDDVLQAVRENRLGDIVRMPVVDGEPPRETRASWLQRLRDRRK